MVGPTRPLARKAGPPDRASPGWGPAGVTAMRRQVNIVGAHLR